MARSNRAQAASHHWKVPELEFGVRMPPACCTPAACYQELDGGEEMKKLFVTATLAGMLILAATAAFSQGAAKNGPDVVRDPDMEKESLHNLEVARQYFKLRKAYKASLDRCEEILAGNPAFSKIDEVLLIAGQSNLRLSESKGKQKVATSRDELKEAARNYLSQLVNDYPDSKFRNQALEDLKPLGGPKPKESKP
jgi:outer membrane protein assembly factor BamD (BamD/ComL family)